MENRYAIVLAAGKGTRMNSQDPNKSKLMYEILSKPIISYAFFHVNNLKCQEKIIVLGFGGTAIKSVVPEDWKTTIDDKILGTGISLKKATELLKGKEGNTFVFYGDMPLLRTRTLKALFEKHNKNKYDLTFLTNYVSSSKGRNRIIREEKTDRILEIREKKEEGSSNYIYEVDAGAYIFNNKILCELINCVKPDENGEYSLISLVKVFVDKGKKVGTFVCTNEEECLSINDRIQLETATNVMKRRINERLMGLGVTIEDSSSTYICPDAIIGKDTVIHPNTYIHGKTVIGSNNGIGPDTYLDNCKIGNDNTITFSNLKNSVVKNKENIGPYKFIVDNKEVK